MDVLYKMDCNPKATVAATTFSIQFLQDIPRTPDLSPHVSWTEGVQDFKVAEEGRKTSSCDCGSATNAPNVVAIDNKIEQAMDLVKSHLMYAVREEVEVLKEQIKELIERNQQLERENSLLKQNASSDVLEQLNTLQPPPTQNQPPTTTS
ncbi:hypothetical protein Bbelb_086250 [Branchiostoma belcheri]|nr:hypothetical protein Bbelb_086250 [Branchiostoma belcheri]